jgi:hypothetical protein
MGLLCSCVYNKRDAVACVVVCADPVCVCLCVCVCTREREKQNPEIRIPIFILQITFQTSRRRKED